MSREKYARIGEVILVKFEQKLLVQCTIDDYKYSYGRDRWLISPIGGSGQIWIENDKISQKQ